MRERYIKITSSCELMKKELIIVLFLITLLSVNAVPQIHSVTAPTSVTYDEAFTFSFIVEPDEPMNDVTIGLRHHQKTIFVVPSMTTPQNFTIDMEGKMLHSPIVVEVTYEGGLFIQEVPIQLKASFLENIPLFFRKIFSWIFG